MIFTFPSFDQSTSFHDVSNKPKTFPTVRVCDCFFLHIKNFKSIFNHHWQLVRRKERTGYYCCKMKIIKNMAENDEGRELRYAGERCDILAKVKSTVDGLLASGSHVTWSTYGGLARISDNVEQVLIHGSRIVVVSDIYTMR